MPFPAPLEIILKQRLAIRRKLLGRLPCGRLGCSGLPSGLSMTLRGLATACNTLRVLGTGKPVLLAGTSPVSRPRRFQAFAVTAFDHPVKVREKKISARTGLDSVTVLGFMECDVVGGPNLLISSRWGPQIVNTAGWA